MKCEIQSLHHPTINCLLHLSSFHHSTYATIRPSHLILPHQSFLDSIKFKSNEFKLFDSCSPVLHFHSITRNQKSKVSDSFDPRHFLLIVTCHTGRGHGHPDQFPALPTHPPHQYTRVHSTDQKRDSRRYICFFPKYIIPASLPKPLAASSKLKVARPQSAILYESQLGRQHHCTRSYGFLYHNYRELIPFGLGSHSGTNPSDQCRLLWNLPSA